MYIVALTWSVCFWLSGLHKNIPRCITSFFIPRSKTPTLSPALAIVTCLWNTCQEKNHIHIFHILLFFFIFISSLRGLLFNIKRTILFPKFYVLSDFPVPSFRHVPPCLLLYFCGLHRTRWVVLSHPVSSPRAVSYQQLPCHDLRYRYNCQLASDNFKACKGPFTPSVSVNTATTQRWRLRFCSHWNQWNCLKIGCNPILEQLHWFQWEQNRKHHRWVVAALTLTLGVNGS